MISLDAEATLLLIGILLLTTVLAGTLSSRFGLPALIGFLGLGMLAGVEGPGGIAFSNFSTAQSVGTAPLIFILFSGGWIRRGKMFAGWRLRLWGSPRSAFL
jgi:cell volume regulation protein A